MNNLQNGWQVKSLGEVAKVKSGFAFKSEDYLERGVKLVRIGNLNGSGLEFGDETVFVYEKYLSSCSEFSLKENDVLIAMSGATTGKLALVKQKDLPCLLNQRVGLISISNHQNLNAKYLFYYLAKGDLRKQVLKLAGGSAQPNISPTQIMSFKIPLPPFPIQKQIAEILEKADEAKQKRKEANKLTDEFLQSVFIEMFGDPVKNPKGWAKKKLVEVCDQITDGEHITPPRTEFGVKLLSARNVKNGFIDFSTGVDFISAETYQKISKRCKPEYGDVLMSCSGTIGRVTTVKINENFHIVRSVALLKTNKNKLLGEYLEYYLRSDYGQYQVQSKAKKSSQANIFTAPIKSIDIFMPPLSLQKQFAEIVNKTEALKEKQKQSEQELENLFQSLMQKAFKGELVS